MTEVTWEVVNSPDLAIVKGGFFEYYVGDNKQSSFNIKVKNGTGSTGVHIDDTAGAGQHKSLTIDTDSTNKDGVIGLNIFMSSSTGVDSIASQAISLEGDATGFNNSILTFIDMNLIGAGNNNEVDAIHVNPLVSQIIEMGSADTLSSSYYEDLNITANVTNVGADAEVFADDNEYIYIGDSLNFTTISFALSTFSSKDIEPEYFYCDSAGTWQTLTGVVDTTDGFRISGSISFTNPTDRGVCNKEYDDTAFSDTANYTYIAIKRTESKDIVVSPVIDRIDISGSTDYFILQKDMIKLQGISSPPETCSASFAGAIYYDSNVNYHCSCNAVNWVRMSDPTDTTGCS